MIYQCIAADPPWSYTDGLKMSTVKRSSGDHYRTMSVDAICDLAVLSCKNGHTVSTFAWLLRQKHCAECGHLLNLLCVAGHQVADTAILYLWVTNSFLIDGSGARVCKAWGFKPKQLITWVKGRLGFADDHSAKLVNHVGMGHHTRGCTEHIILAVRGKSTTLITDKGVPNVFIAPRTRHSAKPQAAYDLIERVQGAGPRLELFARQPRAGWTVHGDEVTA